MKRYFAICSMVFLMPLLTNAQGNRSIKPTKAGFDKDSLGKISELLDGYIAKGLIPGANVLVARNGKIVFENSYGYSDREEKRETKTSDIYRIASMTKPIVSAAIMQLYEQGKINFNDPVSKFIPELGNVEVLKSFNKVDTTWTTKPLETPITIHHLLTHTSGINYGFTNPKYGAIYGKLRIPDAAHPFDFTIHDMMKSLAKAPLAHQPGSRWTYGLSTDVLGAVVEKVSGERLDVYVQKNILDPLGMKHTGFWLKDELKDDLVALYLPNTDTAITRIPDEGRGFFKPNYPIEGAKKYHSGGSGISSTTRDYFVFCQAILNGGIYNGERILKESTVNFMRDNQITDIPYLKRAGFGFGYGYSVAMKDSDDFKQVKTGKFSWGGAFGTTFWIDPTRDIVVVLMSQVLSGPHKNAIDDKLESIVNGALVDIGE